MRRVAINGRFLVRRQTGQERFAKQTVKYLDKIADSGQYTLVVPNEYHEAINLRNICVVRYGNTRSHTWEQVDFARYILKKNMIGINLCTTHPLLRPDIVCIHDICYKVNPQFYRTMYGRLSMIWHRVNYWFAAKLAKQILTVTEVSRKEIASVYHVDLKRITVVPNGWEHIIDVVPDDSITNEMPQIKLDEYFVTIGSLMPQKNIGWILAAAKTNPEKQFVIVGRASTSEYGDAIGIELPKNIITTGYLRDGQLKYLLLHCRALIFPSIYEGFGIPPLEALALGKEAIVANCSCMPEIYGNSVHYLDPANPNVNIEDLMRTPIESADMVLQKYRYEDTAKIINNIVQSMMK